MKTSTLLFFGALAAMFAVDYLFSYLPKAEYQTQAIAHPHVREYLDNLHNPIDLRDSPAEEREFSFGYIARVYVLPGIRVVHDPTMGREVTARGPAPALDLLNFNTKEGHFTPDFKKAILLSEPVEIRLNLEAHGSERMRISTLRPQRRSVLHAEFLTAGPLTFRFLEVINAGEQKVEVDAENLLVWAHNNLRNISGRAGRVEVMERNNPDVRKELPLLDADTIIRSPYTDISTKLNNAFKPVIPDSTAKTDTLLIQ